MSLINDALKRAKATQPKSASADGPALMRPDFAPMPRRQVGNNDLLLPALIIVILLLAGLLIWQWLRGSGGEVQVHARTIDTFANVQPAAPTPASQAPVAAVPQNIAPVVVSSNAITPEIGSQAVSTLASTTVSNQPSAVQAPPPITYKLQSVFYRAKSSSAVINGKTLFVGDRVGNARLTVIGKESVTIVTRAGETNVLELP